MEGGFEGFGKEDNQFMKFEKVWRPTVQNWSDLIWYYPAVMKKSG